MYRNILFKTNKFISPFIGCVVQNFPFIEESIDGLTQYDLLCKIVEKLNDNFVALYDAIVKAKPAASKGQYIKSISVSSTMGPGVSIKA